MQFATLSPTKQSGPGRPRALRAHAASVVTHATDVEAALNDATQTICEACVNRQYQHIVEAAKKILPHRRIGTAGQSLARMLSQSQPARIEVRGEGRAWMLQRLDGSMLGLLRMRSNGEVYGAQHPNESRWVLRDGCLLLADTQGLPTSVFTVAGSWEGQRVLVGLFKDGETVHVLSEVNCSYSRLYMLDPELIAPYSAVFATENLPTPWMPPQPAVILAAPRTGSHLLLNLLNSSGRVFFDSELMNATNISIFGKNLKPEEAGALYSLRSNDPVHFLKVMLTRSHHIDGFRLDQTAVRGFKLFPSQSKKALDWVMDETCLRIVHLYRANLLAEYSSILVAFSEGHWVGGPSTLKNHRIIFQAERFLEFVAMKQRYLDKVRELLVRRGGNWCETEYSEFSRASVNQVLTFLLDQPSNFSLEALGLERQLNIQVIDRFENPDDVRRCLAAIGQEAWAGVERPTVQSL